MDLQSRTPLGTRDQAASSMAPLRATRVRTRCSRELGTNLGNWRLDTRRSIAVSARTTPPPGPHLRRRHPETARAVLRGVGIWHSTFAHHARSTELASRVLEAGDTARAHLVKSRDDGSFGSFSTSSVRCDLRRLHWRSLHRIPIPSKAECFTGGWRTQPLPRLCARRQSPGSTRCGERTVPRRLRVHRRTACTRNGYRHWSSDCR